MATIAPRAADPSSWITAFPYLATLDDSAWQDAVDNAKVLNIPRRTQVFREGDDCASYILMLEGRVRVYKTSETGREITLYRVENKQTCVLTTAMLLGGELYPAAGITEIDSHAVVIPRDHFHHAFDNSSGFRRFVCAEYAGRICGIILLLEEVAFGQIDARLARWLLMQWVAGEPIAISHRELAVELGTAREVISRQLKDFENRGWLKMSRRSIDITSADALRNLAEGQG